VHREAFNGVTKFGEFQSTLCIARNTLTERLDRLTGAGLLARKRYQSKPSRYEYLLTDAGRDFYPVLTAIMHWGDRWLADDGGPPVTLHHLDCGQQTHASVVCARCGGELAADHVRQDMKGPASPRG